MSITEQEKIFFSYIKEGRKEEIIAHFKDTATTLWEYKDGDGYSSNYPYINIKFCIRPLITISLK